MTSTHTTTRCTTADLEWAIHWLGAYEGDREGWESLQRAAEFLGREMRDRIARQIESDWKRDNLSPTQKLTTEGAELLRNEARRIADDEVAQVLRAGNSTNGSLRHTTNDDETQAGA